MFDDSEQTIDDFNVERGEDFLVPAAITDTGCERDLNEDRYAVIDSRSGVGWFVCDGMGGTSGGELAAQLAIDAIRRDLDTLPERSPAVALESAFIEANRVIVLRRQNQAFASMGTTIVGAIFKGEEVAIGHVGDSRAYLVRDSAIQQLTKDHTLVQEWVDRGEILPEEALSHPQSHVLTKCVGSEAVLEPDIKTYWVWPCEDGEVQDSLVLCSDGMYSLVSESELASIVSKFPPQDACVQLVELAKERGGYDNITLAVVPFGGQLKEQAPMLVPRHLTKKVAEREFKIGNLGADILKAVLLSGLLIAISTLVVVFLILSG